MRLIQEGINLQNCLCITVYLGNFAPIAAIFLFLQRRQILVVVSVVLQYLLHYRLESDEVITKLR